MIIYYIEVA